MIYFVLFFVVVVIVRIIIENEVTADININEGSDLDRLKTLP